ncbi:MAG TPA: hypothetical protein VL400_11455 [Polyangiaceae bacterium]|jgi:hypothetical protein|nr:hypothetical protein [Polyangiaceae bacterium]
MSANKTEERAFSARLSDLLSTLESTATLGLAESRIRGLGEQLAFACAALPCAEALVALESQAMGRLRVPVVGHAGGFREVDLEIVPEGTPFSYALAGGGTQALTLEPDDPSLGAVRGVLATPPTAALFSPIRMGDGVVGALVLTTDEGSFADQRVEMAERLASVVALTAEAFFTERMLFELFARALPDVLGKDAATSLPRALVRHVHSMRLSPAYQRRLELAVAIGRLTAKSDLEARLCSRVLEAFDGYLSALEGGAM